MLHFWYDEEMASINMWDKGRRTDRYRNKNRILGENMSLFMQMISCYKHWTKAGWSDRKPSADYEKLLDQLPKHTLVRFAEGRYDRALAIVRDRGHVWSLPLINGGKPYYQCDPYLPVPHENMVLNGVPDQAHGNLLPEVVLTDGRRLWPVSFIEKVEASEDGETFRIFCSQSSLCVVGGEGPEAMEGIRADTVYEFQPGKIRRTDCFALEENIEAVQVRLTALYYEDGKLEEGKFCPETGSLISMKADGYERWERSPALRYGSFDTPRGPLKTAVHWSRTLKRDERQFSVSWEIQYSGK